MTEPLFVSYYTPAYADHAAGLVRSLEAFALDYSVVAIEDRGGWQANTAYKPQFLLEHMVKDPGRWIVWVDADARVERCPEALLALEDNAHDHVAYHVFRLSGGREEALSGTVAVRSPSFVAAWADAMNEYQDLYDQVVMDRVAARGFKVHELPAEYCWIDGIFDKPFYRRNHPEVGPPVIRHLQASRELRNVRS